MEENMEHSEFKEMIQFYLYEELDLDEDRSELLVFRDGDEDWLEFGDYTYRKCN